MLDLKVIRQNPEWVQKGARDKRFEIDIAQLLAHDAKVKALQQELEELQCERNNLSKEIGKARGEEQDALKERVKAIKVLMETIEEQLNPEKEKLQELMLRVPQPAKDHVPLGRDDADNVEIRRWGQVPQPHFPLKDHVTLGEELGLIDFPRGVKLSGSRSYVLTGLGSLLEHAIMRFALDFVVAKGYRPMSVPVLVNENIMTGTGYFPTGRDQAYCIEKDELALVGTSEVPLCGFHSDETFELRDLPLRLTAQSTCFRREAGTYGKDTRGLYRVHQFQKVEMVIFAPADKDLTEKLHLELLGISEDILKAFELPYRVVHVCTGDLGLGQVEKHDIETWMPSRQAYGETHSCSSFFDFQARRLNIRYRDGGKNHIAYTLNNTAIAAPRAILAILENFQNEDGSVTIPKVLRPYMGGREVISPRS